jgi:hemerythrin superfamily protein
MNAIQVIKRDHREVEDLYAQYQEAAGDSEREDIAKEIFDGLDAHAKMEETFFYPALKKEGEKEEDLVKQAQAEHNDIKQLIARGRGKSGEDLDVVLEELMSDVMHHVKEEEEEILPDAEKTLGERALQKLGAEMEPHSASEKAKQSSRL